MPIELRILSGTRAGQTESFDKSVIAVGRHALSDLRFDPTGDIDVSTRHGEIRGLDGRYMVHDSESTNGTFVNGQRVPHGGAREVHSGDVIGFGAHGPTVSVRITEGRATPVGSRATEEVAVPFGAISSPSAAASPPPQRRPTTERVAIAVAEQTRGLKVAVFGAIIVLGGLGAAGYWMGHREAAASDAKLQQLMASYEQSSQQLQNRLGTNDSSLIRNLKQERDSLIRLARSASGSEAVVMQQSLQRHATATRAISSMDPGAVSQANNAAVVLIRFRRAGKLFEATGFSVSPSGQIVTNRHVSDDNGGRATDFLVKFADTDVWRHARVLRTLPDTSVDLALLQVEEAGTYPAVASVASASDVTIGAPIVSIGFPEGTDLPMDGAKATTTLTVGVVSKNVPEVLQVDSYASHGSSGSPVFDARGRVIGVIYGGPKDSAGRIVFAVPGAKIAELLRT